MFKLKLTIYIFIFAILFSCEKMTIRSKESSIALPLAEIYLTPEVFIKNFLSTSKFLRISYIQSKGDSLATMNISIPFNIGEVFNGLGMSGAEGTVIPIFPLNGLIADLGQVEKTLEVDGFSKLNQGSNIIFNEPIKLFIPVFNGFNKNIMISSSFKYLDKNGNQVPGVLGDTIDNIPANGNKKIEIHLTGFSQRVTQIKVKFSFSFPSGDPNQATLQKNGLPLYFDSIYLQIPLDLSIQNFKLDSSFISHKSNNPFKSNLIFDITSAYIECYLKEGSKSLPLSNIGLILDFLDEKENSVVEKSINLFPSIGQVSSMSIDIEDAIKIKETQYIRFYPGATSNNVSIRIIKGTSIIRLNFKLTGKVDYELSK